MTKHLKDIIKLHIQEPDHPVDLGAALASAEGQIERDKAPTYEILPEIDREVELKRQKDNFFGVVKEAMMKRKSKKKSSCS